MSSSVAEDSLSLSMDLFRLITSHPGWSILGKLAYTSGSGTCNMQLDAKRAFRGSDLFWRPDSSEHFLAALNLAGFITGTFLQQSPPSKEIVFVNIGLTYRFDDRLGRPEGVANVALFLASDDSSYVIGVDIIVGGGMKVW